MSCSALIAGYAQQGQGKEALKCFDKMRHVGRSPIAIAFICALKACADVGAVVKCKEIQNEINRLVWLERDSVLGNSVVNMYVEGGPLAKAEGVCMSFVLGMLSLEFAYCTKCTPWARY